MGDKTGGSSSASAEALPVRLGRLLVLVPIVFAFNQDASAVEETLPSDVASVRIRAGFETAPIRPVDLSLYSRAVLTWKSRLFSAAVCADESPPRLGCAKLAPISNTASIKSIHLEAESEALVQAADELRGVWQGDNYVLRIDPERAQAREDGHLAFNWRRFVVHSITPDTVAFVIGRETFEARIDGEIVVLTSSSFIGERRLRRAPGGL